jgi:hypothetical protein
MAHMSDYLEQAVINAVLRGTAYSTPAVGDLHLALFTSDPTDANTTANEVSAAWYARQTTGTWTAPTAGDGVSRNSSTVTFPAVTGAQIVITHIGIYDAAVGGNLLFHAPLVASKTLDIGDVISFAASSISVTLA